MKYFPLVPIITIGTAILVAAEVSATTYRATQRMAGFSTDGNHYVYLESSRDTGAGIPKARLQIVEISSNSCVQNGCIETQFREPDSSLSNAAAEDSLLQTTWNLRQNLGLTPPVAGTRLAVVSRSRAADGTEIMAVRLNNREQPLRLRLQQRTEPSNIVGFDRAAMRLELTRNNRQRSLGSLSNFQEGILRYSLREVYLSPDRQSIVVLMTATRPTFEGVLETTLVQGFDL